jgi:L-arabinokinase
MPTVAFYISGHGFGHASRQIEILNALADRSPEITILLRTAVPRWLLERTLRAPFCLYDSPCDTGVVQIDSLRLDPKVTMDRAREFYQDFEARVQEEAALLTRHGAGLVIADAPPLACAAAAAAGIPGIVVSNFTWDVIYEEYHEYLASAPDVIPVIRRAYSQAEAGWRLPLHCGFGSIERIVDVPFVARHSRRERNETRAHFGIDPDRPAALVSFGGYGLDGLDLERLDCRRRWTVLVTGKPPADTLPSGVQLIDNDRIYEDGFRYEDLVRAVDVVVTKPGYGIVSECIANRTAMLYTSRGRFAEYPYMVAAMPDYLRCAYIDHDDLFAGRWERGLDAVSQAAEPPEVPSTNGAEVVAGMIAQRFI